MVMLMEAAIPQHITGIYVFAVVNLLLLLCLAGVDADIIVKDLDSNETVDHFSDQQARFGPDFPKHGLEGRVVVAEPPEACSPVKRPPAETSQYKWILLISRGGNCEFSDKVLAAQEKQFDAVVVYNYKGNESLVEMQACSNGSQVMIPSTFVGYSSGMSLKTHYNYQTEYIVKIIEQEDEISYTSLLWVFAIVIAICFLMVMIFMLVKFLRDHASRRFNRLSRKHLKKIPVRKFKKGDYYDTCAICLDEYEEGEKIRVLPCDHVYHTKCIDPWLTKSKKTCPVCKRRVIPGRDADSESGSDSDDGGATSRNSSETTPLLQGESSSSRINPAPSSVTVIVVNDTASGSAVPQTAEGYGTAVAATRAFPDLEDGAVGGVGISERHHRHQAGSVRPSVPRRGNVQEGDDARRNAHPDRKRRRHERDKKQPDFPTEDDMEGTVASMGAEGREDRRERRRKKKEKKRSGRSHGNRDDIVSLAQQAESAKDETERVYDEDDVYVHHSSAFKSGQVSTGLAESETTDGQHEVDDEEAGYVNPSYSESQEVTLPRRGRKHEMNELV